MSKPYKLMSEEEKKEFNNYCMDRWRQRKLKAIEYKGGKCERCDYDKYPDVLEFHHRDPEEKEANWTKMRLRSWDKIQQELDKCDLLCANCHREVHIQMRCLSSSVG